MNTGHSLLFALVLLAFGTPLDAQEPAAAFYAVDGDSIHYLDFGGDGLPVVFIHAADRGAVTWMDFAPHLVDEHRVLAVTARGVAPSAGLPQPTEVRASDLVALLDELGLVSAVFIGNSSPASDMVQLATAYPDRVAGLVFLAGAPVPSQVYESDPTGAFTMAMVATQPPIRFPFRPVYLDDPERRFASPALTFVTPGGTRGVETGDFPTMVGGLVAQRGGDWIEDPDARAFFERMAIDSRLQTEVARAWQDDVVPAILANERAFWDAFEGGVSRVELPVQTVTGYEYMDSPELILPHIREFISGLGR